ncbi:DUF3995 domain-containing protein [Bacteriovorax sp. BSW11_IV]|uniref:DUF3995 domain-containing protein n=1 Tax=Bacteriovorax sp. BSW11_IV TaxID=1353529 RepID=UPI00055054C0
MNIILGTLLSIIFFTLSLIHVYWLFGGEKGLEEALPFPSINAKSPVFRPGKLGILLVSAILGCLGIFVIIKTYGPNLRLNILPDYLEYYFFNVVAFLFFIRAIGDFKYVGITKKVKGTKFSKWDSFLYIPLCLVISVLTLIINH